MAILFKTTISENTAFEMIERSLSGVYQYDGYLNVVSDAGETALSWGPAMHDYEVRITFRMNAENAGSRER